MMRIVLLVVLIFPSVLFGQIKEDLLFQGLTTEFKYKLLTRDFFRMNGLEKKVPIGDSIALGCSSFEKKGLPIAFMITIRERKGKNKLKMHMYAVRRNDLFEDEDIINALDYYCYYGQNNYYFLSNEYIFFTYSIGGDALLHKDAERMAKMEMQFVKNVNSLSKE